jgi:hypothetical protein
MRTVSTHQAGKQWFYRIHDDGDDPYESPPIYWTRGAALRAGLRDVEMSDMFDAGEVM